MWNRASSQRGLANRSTGLASRSTGFTLPEMLLVIVVMGVGLAGVLIAFSTVGRGSADPVLQKQMLSIAEELMEEIQLRPYVAASNTTPAVCARNTFNDVRDYDGYATSNKICAIDGTAIPALNGYSVSIAVTSMSLVGVAGTLQIVVSVTGQNGQTLNLYGYRTNYA